MKINIEKYAITSYYRLMAITNNIYVMLHMLRNTAKVRLFLWLLVIVAPLSGCGGGGGGGGGGGAAVMTTSADPMPADPMPADTGSALVPQSLLGTDPVDFATRKAEFEAAPTYEANYTISLLPFTDRRLRIINAAAAYARGATGAGETIVIYDTGLTPIYPLLVEFTGGKDITTMDSTPRYSPAPSTSGHGTAVASIALATRNGAIQGVAFDASLIAVSIPLGTGSPSLYTPFDLSSVTEDTDAAYAITLPFAINNRLGYIINQSWGVAGAISIYDLDEVRTRFSVTATRLAQADVDNADKRIVVWAAGNAGNAMLSDGSSAIADSPELFPGLGVAFPELRSHILAVVALDQHGRIASYSNHCGLAKSFCLAAPGSRIVYPSATTPGEYNVGDGTSFAAPLVSGALAVLRQFFRNADGAYQIGNTELVERLLATANKEGIYVNSDIYGQGLIDLDAATAPVGVMMTGLPEDPDSRPLTGSRIELASLAFSSSLGRALGSIPVVGFDALGAPFSYTNDTSWVTLSARAIDISPVPKSYDIPLGQVSSYHNDLSRLSLTIDKDGTIDNTRFTHTSGWWLSYGKNSRQNLGLYDQHYAPLAYQFAHSNAFTAPYLSLTRAGTGGGWSRTLDKKHRIGFALSHGTPDLANQQNPGGERGISAILEYRLSGLSLQAGAVSEAEGFLGARPQGAFGAANAMTTFVGINGNWASSNDRWHLLASAYLGRTRPQIESPGLLQTVGEISSSAFSLGVTRSSMWYTNDWLGIRLSQPLRTENGTANLRIPTGRGKYGEVFYQDHAIKLEPHGRNIQAEVAYNLPFSSSKGSLTTSLGIEHHPQHDSTRSTQPFMKLSFERQF